MRHKILIRLGASRGIRRPCQWYGAVERMYFVRVNLAFWCLTASVKNGIRLAWSRHPVHGTRPSDDVTTGKRMAMKKRRVGGETTKDVKHLAALETVVLGKLHPIVAHAAICQYDDGTPRKTGWITIKTMGSAWVLEAKDPDSAAKITVVQSSLDDALALLSVLLESDEAPWEPDPWLAQMNARGAKNKKVA